MSDQNDRPALPAMADAVVYKRPGHVAVEARPIDGPGAGEVLIEVSHCGICGSDIHMILEGWGTPEMVFGHEFTGSIAAIGADVTGWSVGDAVVGGPSPRCGRCRRCLAGQPAQCENRSGSADSTERDGAFARYALVDSRSLLRLPDGLTSRQAALAEPLAVALHGITRSGITKGDSVMVFGAGPIGALSIAALVARGFGAVTVVEPSASRQALARRLGADRVMDPAELETYPMWEPERISEHAVDVVLECSGKKSAMEAGFSQLCRGGTLVLVGAGIEPPAFDPNRMILNELHVCGSYVYDDRGFEDALALLASGAVPADVLIEPDDVGLDGLGDALLGLASGHIAGKVMVDPRLGRPARTD
ncbi:MAG: Theronine dehydrogenase-like Zn-dependent dehydrogenase [Acidimicrobiales bacterium]|nr:Theronine dehydrogenase-like Zn-dependent dehydrogenase [Acidimicrobiales bacterium]